MWTSFRDYVPLMVCLAHLSIPAEALLRSYGGPTEVGPKHSHLRQGGSTLVPRQPILPTKVLAGSDQVPDDCCILPRLQSSSGDQHDYPASCTLSMRIIRRKRLTLQSPPCVCSTADLSFGRLANEVNRCDVYVWFYELCVLLRLSALPYLTTLIMVQRRHIYSTWNR